MSTTLLTLIISVTTLAFIIGVFRVEDARGGRLVLFVRLRELNNRFIIAVFQRIGKIETYLGKGFVRLMAHYIVHTVLQRVLLFITCVEKKLEHLLRRNKQVAKEIRINKKKTHLDEIAKHKEQTALTEAQKRKLRSHD